MRNPAPKDNADLEALEQREWREALDYVIQQGDRGRVERLLATVRDHARMSGVPLPFTAVTAYVNTIQPDQETPLPGSQEIVSRATHRPASTRGRSSRGGSRARSSTTSDTSCARAVDSRPTPIPG